MESGEVGEPPFPEYVSSLRELSLSEQLDEWCAYYMAIGVPYEEFWYGDYCKLKYYVEAYRLKKKQDNERLWLQGMYFYDAVATALGNAFRDKGAKPKDYAKEPYDVVQKSEREEEIEAEKIRLRVIDNLNAVAEQWKRTQNAKDSGAGNSDKQ